MLLNELLHEVREINRKSEYREKQPGPRRLADSPINSLRRIT